MNVGDEHRMRRERIREWKQSRDSMACVCRGAAVMKSLIGCGALLVEASCPGRELVEGAGEAAGTGRNGGAWRSRREPPCCSGGPGEKSGLAMRGGQSVGPQHRCRGPGSTRLLQTHCGPS